MMRHLITSDISEYSRWDVILVPFPFVETVKSKKRPALVLSNSNFNKNNNHIIAAMITSSTRSVWKDDYRITDINSAGLPKSCIVRWKIFTLPQELVEKKIGEIGAQDKGSLTALLAGIMLG